MTKGELVYKLQSVSDSTQVMIYLCGKKADELTEIVDKHGSLESMGFDVGEVDGTSGKPSGIITIDIGETTMA